jgi:hypothetical protein
MYSSHLKTEAASVWKANIVTRGDDGRILVTKSAVIHVRMYLANLKAP